MDKLYLVAASLPQTNPNYNWPGEHYVALILDMILGIVILFLVGTFFAGFAVAGRGFFGGKDGGVAKGAGLIFGSAILLALIGGGTAYLSQWVHFFGSA